jgi:DNA primase
MSDFEFQSEEISFEELNRKSKTSKLQARRKPTMKQDSEESLKEEYRNDVMEDPELAKNSVFTGLVVSKGRTHYPIVQAFLMQGDFTVFITMDED